MPKAVQVNLQHSKCATENLDVLLREEDIDIGFIQEPWVGDAGIKGFQENNNFNLFYTKSYGKPRSCIVTKKHIKAFLCSNFSTPDFTIVKVEMQKSAIYLASAYMPHDKPAPPDEVARLLSSINNTDRLLMGCDANARHELWGSSETNDRGESLFDFILNTNLDICNVGTTPTFTFPSSENFPGWEEVLDVTLSTNNNSQIVSNWRVSDKKSFSDHSWILFDINLKLEKPTPYRNPRRTNWHIFSRIAQSKLQHINKMITSSKDLDEKARAFEVSMTKGFEASCPVTYGKTTYPIWWNEDLSQLRKMTREIFNICYKHKYFKPYKDCLREYKNAIREAQTEAWKDFCSSIESTKETARLGKLLSKEHSCPSFLRKDNGEWTKSSSDTLEYLINIHFPGNTDYIENNTNSVQTSNLSSKTINHIVSQDRILWAIKNFEPYKAAGPDGIFPAMLWNTRETTIPWLEVFFKKSLMLGHIPKSWRRVKVIFIPKAGRRGHDTAKDFRPISLSSFILKTLERLLDVYLREKITNTTISTSQHAYLKGKSTETALHEVVSTIERSIEYKQYSLVAFLDIEGAFNNVNTSSITEALIMLGSDIGLNDWINNMLKTRIIIGEVGSSKVKRSVVRGTPQGGVLSPLLWLLVVNNILSKFDRKGIKAVAYADDIVLIVSGMFPTIISEIMEGALGLLSNWATDCGLSVNPSKTELMLFTRKTKIPNFNLPKLNGVSLTLTQQAKYLGVILDPKLSWRPNIEYRVKKAYIALYTCKRMLGKKWGLQPKLTNWSYTAIVRPILTYAALVWWPAIEKKYNQTRLNKIQRSACILTTGALSTSPTEALNVLTHLLPLDLHIKTIATCSAVRLRDIGCWTTRLYGHSKILLQGPSLLKNKSDFTIPDLNFKKDFTVRFPPRAEWRKGKVIGRFDSEIYTDGSKMNCGVGAGLYSEPLNLSKSIRLPDHASVFQAELLAIREACKSLKHYKEIGARVAIFSDSQAAIKALDSNSISSKLVLQCREELELLGHWLQITLIWVPGHRNIEGNEMADELARKGSALDITEAVAVATPFSTIKTSIASHYYALAERRWKQLTTCTTTRKTWPSYKIQRTNYLLGCSRPNISRITATLTGHWKVGDHAARLNLPFNPICRSCQAEGVKESLFHYLCECPGLARARLRSFGRPFLEQINEISDIEIKSLLLYLDLTKWI